MFTEGDIAIAIEWYDRDADDADGLSFTKELNAEGAASRSIVNSTELRASSSTPFDNGLHFTMAPVVEKAVEPAFRPAPPEVTPAVTRTGRGGGAGGGASAAGRHGVCDAREGGSGDPPRVLVGWAADVDVDVDVSVYDVIFVWN